jgi:DNA-binding PadR family transcriptional regulator
VNKTASLWAEPRANASDLPFCLKADWKESETGREAKFYSLTRSGQKQLRAEKDSWARLTGAVQLIFDEGAAQ